MLPELFLNDEETRNKINNASVVPAWLKKDDNIYSL